MKRVGYRYSVDPASRTARGAGVALILTVAAVAGVTRAVVRFPDASAPTLQQAARKASAPPAAAKLLASANPKSVEPTWDIANLDHPRVDYWIDRFTSDKREEYARFLERSGRYVPMISAKLEERGMPRDLIYLAMIESGFNPTAYSHAHASGLWQFIAATGRNYGLDINRAVDERNDPVKATDAALDYLTDLHDRFGSWYLAAAGYNSGENRIGRIMRQVTGSERGTAASYYRIWDRLPRETRDYVPLMIAAARIAKDPTKYGFDDVDVAAPLTFDQVMVDPATPLSAVAKAAGTTVDEIHRLNPHFKLNRTRNDERSAVRIPDGSDRTFAANWSAVRSSDAYAKASTVRYRVRRGDNLTGIARRHGVTIAQLRRANGIRGDFIRAGAVLTIPS